MAKQARRVVGYDQDYPGSYRWKRYAVLCPECGQWVEAYGEVSTEVGGHEHHLCLPCGDKVCPREEQTA